MTTYRLDIYTWPAMRGTPVDLRTSYHESPESALAALKNETQPYAYATLQSLVPGVGWAPCDWQGHPVYEGDTWPLIRGTNGEHPLYLEYMADREYLRAETKRRYLAQPEPRQRGTGDILLELIRERHPRLSNSCDNLAWEIAGDLS